jgi:hypothetical protein
VKGGSGVDNPIDGRGRGWRRHVVREESQGRCPYRATRRLGRQQGLDRYGGGADDQGKSGAPSGGRMYAMESLGHGWARTESRRGGGAGGTESHGDCGRGDAGRPHAGERCAAYGGWSQVGRMIGIGGAGRISAATRVGGAATMVGAVRIDCRWESIAGWHAQQGRAPPTWGEHQSCRRVGRVVQVYGAWRMWVQSGHIA